MDQRRNYVILGIIVIVGVVLLLLSQRPSTPPVAPLLCAAESDDQFCSRLDWECGNVSGLDNCGTTRSIASCGVCLTNQTCVEGRCLNYCKPETNARMCSRLGKECGSIDAQDNCGKRRIVGGCGECGKDQACSQNTCVALSDL